jgi:mannose-6-phosphate isomerase-like protein (cupin superfamily)
VGEVDRQADRVLDFHPTIGMCWEITQSAADTSGALLECTNWFDARMPGPPPHMHPNCEETFQVLEGSLEVFKDGAWTTLKPGESATVPAGTPHSLRNGTDEPTKIVMQMQPAGRSEEFFRHIHTLIRDGKMKGPRDLRSGIYFAMLFEQYPDVSRTTGPSTIAFRALTLTGKALRYKL